MASNLLIVESPAKSKTIEGYLGLDYQVLASFGHVRDLPKSTLGVDVKANFKPKYIIPKKSQKVLNQIKQALKNKKNLYIATDLDREGEAIGWHVIQALGLNQPKKGQPAVKRITFHEITKSALEAALKNPREINQNLVDAQQARRVLDRLVGYTLSPFLWRKIYKGLSAGRVQSVALRLIVEREKERQSFKSEDYWSIKSLLATTKNGGKRFIADLVSIKGKKLESLSIKSAQEGEKIIEKLKKEAFVVDKAQTVEQKRYPKSPFTTSTLQQEAVNRLNFTAKKTMALAQHLYEAGLITYMRTDSVSINPEAIGAIRSFVAKSYGSQYLPEKANTYQSKSKNAQEAHEAIRPTNLTQDSGKTTRGLEPSLVKLYQLIWQRALASQMVPAVFARTSAEIIAGEFGFRANGSRLVFDGFMRVLDIEESEEKELPELKKDQKLTVLNITSEKHTTEPPPRFTEARLIKTLEELGIGRPSTYAPIIDTLMARFYVHLEAKQLVPEEVGFNVSDLLTAHFPEIVDSDFTAEMEADLDTIAQGKKKWPPVIKKFWQPFSQKVKEKSETVAKINSDIMTDLDCEKCGQKMVEKVGRFGRFLACSGFPDCKNTKAIIKSSTLICPRDGSFLTLKRTKRRKNFFGCPNFPKCNFALWQEKDMEKKINELKAKGEKLKFEKEATESVKSEK